MHAAVRAIQYHVPKAVVNNEDLAHDFPSWTSKKIADKTGIQERHIAAPDECSSDLAVMAAQKLFASGACRPDDIDFLLLCTQSPDYYLPTTACILQDRLGLPTSAGALDFNLGCSGFIYGLSLAKGLIETDQAANVLLLTAETYSKFLHPADRSVRPLFGDAAAATLIQGREESPPSDLSWIGPFVFGTDGKGMENLIVPRGGMRQPRDIPGQAGSNGVASGRSADHLYMNGPEIFTFSLEAVPRAVHAVLAKARRSMDEIDLFVFHQANRFMLESLRNKLGIPADKFVFAMSHVGNTVSSTIPIALKQTQTRQQLSPGKLVLLVGFGVGYSWGATLIHWAL
jgi:3-oxoacyl-[acyl-carrier-protein] synthase III